MQPPLVVFVPGFMQRGSTWDEVAGRVGERYPTSCLDFASHTFEERIAELRAAAAPGSAVVGYSMGGRLALHVAVAEPRRFSAAVVLSSTGGLEDADERRRRRDADEELAAWMETASIKEVVERWEKLPVFEGQSPELVEAQRPGRLSHDPAQLAALLRTAGQGVLPPVWDEMAALAAPLLAIAGERDVLYTAAARRLAAIAPAGRHSVVAGAGHAAHLEHPAEVAADLLAFLDRALTGPAAPARAPH
jgi:2-succinyl-6-hydroxy-2,4-cyclohexadiene-1-carboxylate synthase